MKVMNRKTTAFVSRAVMALAIGALAACSSTPEQPTPISERVEKRTCTFPKTKEEAPEWVCPWWTSDGDIMAVGNYGPSEAPYDFQVRMASLRARHTIAENLSVRFKGSTKGLIEAMGEGNGEAIDTFSQEVASQLSAMDLPGSRIHDAVNGPDGALYVLVGLDRKLAAEAVKRIARSSLGNRQAQWQALKAEKALQVLDKDVDREFGYTGASNGVAEGGQ
ncbi:MAG: hypothetical protein IPM37_15595 [Hahellaceae bacterium]|nr:hypothetical protein [Hahellaceae bacterium]